MSTMNVGTLERVTLKPELSLKEPGMCGSQSQAERRPFSGLSAHVSDAWMRSWYPTTGYPMKETPSLVKS